MPPPREAGERAGPAVIEPAPSTSDSPGTEQPGAPGDGPVPGPEDDESRVQRTAGEVTSPRVIRKVEPDYTEKALKAKLQGVVTLAVEVWQDGKTHNIRVLRGLGMGLDEKAIEAVEQWVFEPGRKNGQPVKVAAQIRVSFRILVDPPSR